MIEYLKLNGKKLLINIQPKHYCFVVNSVGIETLIPGIHNFPLNDIYIDFI
jgi:hypothetical protein